LTTARYYTPSNRSIQAKGIDPDILIEEELPDDLKAKMANEKPRGEASLRGHLKNADGTEKTEGSDKTEEKKEEVSGSSSYVPKEPEKDTQLQYALSFLRGTAKEPPAANKAATTTPPAATPEASATPPADGTEPEKKTTPN
jgi:carboxyl-terminal processing protease